MIFQPLYKFSHGYYRQTKVFTLSLPAKFLLFNQDSVSSFTKNIELGLRRRLA
jgi:hypothetical protein